MKTTRNLKAYLFQPFSFFAGWTSVITGLFILTVLVVAGFFTHTHFDGVLDVHYGCNEMPASLSRHLYCVFISRIIAIAVFYITAVILSSSKIRLIDIAGTITTAQWPLLFAPLIGFLPGMRFCEGSVNTLNVEAIMIFFREHLVGLLFGVLFMLILLIWSVFLMYNAYSVSANIKGGKGIASFIAALFVAEIISKIALFLIL
ncbi:MAG: hypothetical protein LBP72_06675 [Dysgonamonadaceae bacterium]|jgi:hypothetical protein|nr:hypothetical protein [Dysgonamonadaceae bacterium]